MAEISTPDWVKDAIFYHIFPDRFARSASALSSPYLEPWGAAPTYHGFQGGDLEGITEKLDYLQELGINALYLNPIFQSATNHRYCTHDYYTVDPMLGGNAAFCRLLNAAHARGIRVVLDGVFNHVGRGFFPFHHVLECEQASPYIEWFHVKGFPLRAYEQHGHPNYATWAGHRKFPKLNLNHPAPRRFVLEVARHWLQFGIDGWRLDAFKEIDEDFWREFRQAVKAVNGDAYLLGEIWVDEKHRTASRWLAGDQIDAIMNYGFATSCIGFFIGDRLERHRMHKQAHRPKRTYTAAEFADRLDRMLGNYAAPVVYAQYNLLESHDTARYLTLAGDDPRILKLTVTFQMTYPGAPAIYYGTEVGLPGGRDPDCRRAMPWNESQWDSDILNHYRKLIAICKRYPCLRRGEYTRLHADPVKAVFAFMRQLTEERIVVILNNSDDPYRVEIPLGHYPVETETLTCLLSGEQFTVEGKRLRGPTLTGRSGAVLLAQPTD